MTIEELLKVLEMQEEILQFSHFTHGDAWELGNIIVMEARRRNTPVVLKIRLNSGQTVYQFAFDGITPYTDAPGGPEAECGDPYGNQQPSSPHAAAAESGNPWEIWGWIPGFMPTAAADFPIRVEDVGVVGRHCGRGGPTMWRITICW